MNDGTEVTYLDGRPATVEKGLGGDECIIRFRDGSRLAVPHRHLKPVAVAPAPVPMTTKSPENSADKVFDPPAEESAIPDASLPPEMKMVEPVSNAGAAENNAAPAATP